MQCPACEFQNPEQMQFCGKCGSKLAVSCSRCGFENPAGFGFCGRCGASLNKAQKNFKIDFQTPQSYTPKHLADKILTTRSSIEGERKIVTVLFVDLADSTANFEKLDPENVHLIMDGCFKIMLDKIHKFEGTVNQFRVDGIMAIFGAPVAHEDHSQRACYTALEIQSALKPYSQMISKEYGIEFKMRLGLNSGPVVVGSIGDDLRMDYTADGDTTNLAARMS